MLIYAVAAAAVLYFAYGTVKNRYFSSGNKDNSALSDTQEQNAGDSSDQASEENNQSNADAENDQENTDAQNAQAEGSHLYVTSKDCDDNCEKWKDDAENLKYCQEVCGIIPAAQKESKEECADLSGLEKDYCLRDAAVTKKDLDICEEISDTKLKKVCRNRVVEEILN